MEQQPPQPPPWASQPTPVPQQWPGQKPSVPPQWPGQKEPEQPDAESEAEEQNEPEPEAPPEPPRPVELPDEATWAQTSAWGRVPGVPMGAPTGYGEGPHQPAAGWPPAPAVWNPPPPAVAEAPSAADYVPIPAPELTEKKSRGSRPVPSLVWVLLAEILVVAAGANQWTSDRIANRLVATSNTFLAGVYRSLLTYAWRLTPRSHEVGHVWAAELVVLGVLFVGTGLLLGLLLRYVRSFWSSFAAGLITVTFVSQVALVVAGFVGGPASHRTPTDAFFGVGSPSGFSFLGSVILGVIVGLVAGLVNRSATDVDPRIARVRTAPPLAAPPGVPQMPATWTPPAEQIDTGAGESGRHHRSD